MFNEIKKKKINGQQENQTSFQDYTYMDGKVLTNLLETTYHSSLLARVFRPRCPSTTSNPLLSLASCKSLSLHFGQENHVHT